MKTQISKNQFLEDEIIMLKKKRKAVILAHYYQAVRNFKNTLR